MAAAAAQAQPVQSLGEPEGFVDIVAWPGYIIPFMFVFGPSLLMIGNWHTIALTTITAILGVAALAASLHGYFLRPTRLLERILLFAAAIVLIKPGIWTDLVGFGALALVVISQQVFKGAPQEAAAAPPGE